MNGVTRGGCYGGGWEYHAIRVRNASRHNRVLDYVHSLRGFRLNGVVRGVGISASYVAYRYRSGFRYSSALDYPTQAKGFRSDGVYRGGSVTQTSSVVKVSYKRGDKRGVTYQAVGFRTSEWCIKGRAI